jgi:hypothetical protein
MAIAVLAASVDLYYPKVSAISHVPPLVDLQARNETDPHWERDG